MKNIANNIEYKEPAVHQPSAPKKINKRRPKGTNRQDYRL
jgi:hypothetical protein